MGFSAGYSVGYAASGAAYDTYDGVETHFTRDFLMGVAVGVVLKPLQVLGQRWAKRLQTNADDVNVPANGGAGGSRGSAGRGGGSGSETADELIEVSRWGRPGLEAGDWVMKGKNTWWNYIKSGKFEPKWWKGGNTPAAKATGETFKVPRSTLAKPDEHWLLNGIKSLLGQRTYKP